jgi:hypothetical protein
MRRITAGKYPNSSVLKAWSEALRIRHDIAIGLAPARYREETCEEPTRKHLTSQDLEYYALADML